MTAAGGSADRRNNVENVYVQAPGTGAYTVHVRGFNVPNGPQPYALVVDNGTISAPPNVSVHVGDLETSKTLGSRNWSATVSVTIHNEHPVGGAATAVAGATVNGSWTGAATGTASCLTNSSGVCSITRSNLKNNNTSITFTVTSITGSGLTYNSAANHDADGDSNGTSVTVTR